MLNSHSRCHIWHNNFHWLIREVRIQKFIRTRVLQRELQIARIFDCRTDALRRGSRSSRQHEVLRLLAVEQKGLERLAWRDVPGRNRPRDFSLAATLLARRANQLQLRRVELVKGLPLLPRKGLHPEWLPDHLGVNFTCGALAPAPGGRGPPVSGWVPTSTLTGSERKYRSFK